MNLQVKPSLIILGTLLIGIILGVLLSGALIRERHHRIEAMLGPPRFAERIIKVVKPRDVEKRKAIAAIVEKTSLRIRDLTRETRTGMHAVVDSMFSELKPLLNEEQSKRLEKHLGDRKARAERMGKRMGRGRRF